MVAPKSVNDKKQRTDLYDPTAYRSSMTSREGHVPGRTVSGRVIGVNMVNWTVDVISSFDRQRYLNIQVGSPYLHFSNGEGFFAMPEIGATCMVNLPSDSSPPFVMCFIMPFEKVNDTSAPDAPQGTRSHGGVMPHATDARFDGGRPKAKPGDIMLRGRDGQFITLHRGGVLQIGSTELAQRIYIPLDNHMLDISERYSHHNVGGSILWGLAEGKTDTSVTNTETFRVFANDKYADIRITRGVVNEVPTVSPLPKQVIYEVAIAPKGFNADSGDVADSDTVKNIIYQFALDRDGNVSMVVKGDVFVQFNKKLTIHAAEEIAIVSKKGVSILVDKGLDISGGSYTHVKGEIVRLGAGTQAVARKGDMVQTKVAIPVLCTIVFAGPPKPGPNPGSLVSFQQDLGGVIVSGNDAVKA